MCHVSLMTQETLETSGTGGEQSLHQLQPLWGHLRTGISLPCTAWEHGIDLDTVLCNNMVRSSKEKVKLVCSPGHSSLALGAHRFIQGSKSNKHSTEGPPRG